MLEVVDDDQELAVAHVVDHRVQEWPPAGLADAQGAGDRRGDELGVADLPEADEEDPVLEPLDRVPGEFERQPRLAGAARPRQRDEVDVGPLEQLPHVGELASRPTSRFVGTTSPTALPVRGGGWSNRDTGSYDLEETYGSSKSFRR